MYRSLGLVDNAGQTGEEKVAMPDNREFVLGEAVTNGMRGRTRKDTVVLSVRLPIEEFCRLEAAAKMEGKTVSQVARAALLHRYPHWTHMVGQPSMSFTTTNGTSAVTITRGR